MPDTPLTLEEAATLLDADPELVQLSLDQGSLRSLQLADVRAFRDGQVSAWDGAFEEINAWDFVHDFDHGTVH